MTPDAAVSILLIDANHQDRQWCVQRLSLGSPNYQVFEAANGQSGLNIYRSCFIDCVVLELDLPDMSGFEVLRNLVPNAHRPEAAVIVLTRITNESLLEVAIRNGAQASLLKTQTSGDTLDKAILTAISTVGKVRQEPVADRH